MRGKGEGSVFKDKGSGLWTAIVELPPRDGTRRRKTVRRKTKRELLIELDAMKAQLRLRGDLPTSGQTVEQWLTYWLDQIAVKEVRPNTFYGYRASVKNHIIPAIGKVKLERITPAHIRRVHDSVIIDKELSSTTALLAHRTMSVAFNVAVREGRMGRNPTSLTNAPRKAVAPQEAFDVDEAVTVLRHIARDPVMGARWATALLSAARRGEVIGLELDRVTDVLDLSWQLQRIALSDTPGKPVVPADFEYRHLDGGLYLTRPKSNAGWRVIPLVEPLKSILLFHIENSAPNSFNLVFTINGRPIDPDRDSANWKKVLAEMGFEKDVVLHGLRHTTIDLLYFAGVPEDIIMEIVGQSTRGTLRSYKSRGKVHRQRLVAAMEEFSALLTTPVDSRSDTHEAIES